MKILQVTNLFGATHGGSAQVSHYLSKELASRGHQVSIYTSDFKLDRDSMPTIPDVEICFFKTWLHLVELNITPGMALADSHFDVIHMHNYRTFQNIVAHYYARKYDIPYVLQSHGSLTTFFHKRLLKKAFDKVWGYKLLQDASTVIAVADAEVRHYQEMGVNKDRITVVPNGIDLAEFDNLPEPGKFREKHDLDSDQKIILYLGRIHRIKGLDLLVKAFPTVLGRLSNAKLVIVGPDDGFLAPLSKLVADLGISDRVLFAGPLYGQEKLGAYIDADVFVLPSYYEIFSISLLEACACGVPVVVSNRCEVSQIIDRRAGLIVPCDEQLLADAISSVLSSDEARKRFGDGGKALVREKFNWQIIVHRVEEIYEDAAAKRHKH